MQPLSATRHRTTHAQLLEDGYSHQLAQFPLVWLAAEINIQSQELKICVTHRFSL